ncbi:chloride intracellular channel protein 6-like [Dermacentor silvarum]|uniref:chloride intracellular channel protein 6-like n=1 Tax=Dermacentor silvarum TaxID=543639 RepID=UPI002100D567|nr:chloride intracellular channel protein 6-like [Dermacentor silvarum]
MVYRQQIAVEVIDNRNILEKRNTLIAAQPAVAPATGRQPAHKTRDSITPPHSDTEHMASDLYVASDRSKPDVESPSDWRNFSIGDESAPARKSKKTRASRKGAQETGTLHEPRNLSSLRRLARRDKEAPVKPTKGGPAAFIISTPRPVQTEAPKPLNFLPPVAGPAVSAVSLPEPVDNVMPVAAARDKGNDEDGDSFDGLDSIGDSAPVPILHAPAPSTDAVLPKPSAKRQAAIVKPFEDDHDNPGFLQWYRNAASGSKSAYRGKPVRRNPATASTTPAGAGTTTSQAQGKTFGPRTPRAEQDVAAEMGPAGRGEERQAASVPSDGRPTTVRKGSRKRSVSRSSLTSSQKPGSFATADQSVPPVSQATTQASSSVASAKAPSSGLVTPVAAAPGKWPHGKRQKMSRLSLMNDKPPSDDPQSAFQTAKSVTDHKLNKSDTGPNGSAQHGAALAVDAASTGGPSDIGGAGGELEQAVHDKASPAQPGSPGKTPHTAAGASEAAKSMVKGTATVEGPSGKHKPTSSEPREEGSVASSKAQQLDAGTVTAASQPETTDDSKRSAGKTGIRSLRKLAVGLRRRSRRQRLSRKSLDSNQDVDDTATARAADVSAVSAESAAREPGSSASPASLAGAWTPLLAKPHALEIEAASGLFEQRATAAALEQRAAAAPPPAGVVHESAPQMPTKTTSNETHHSSSFPAAAASVEAKNAAPGDTAGSAGVHSLKESRYASGKSGAERKRRSRRSKKERKASDEQDDHESEGHQ